MTSRQLPEASVRRSCDCVAKVTCTWQPGTASFVVLCLTTRVRFMGRALAGERALSLPLLRLYPLGGRNYRGHCGPVPRPPAGLASLWRVAICCGSAPGPPTTHLQGTSE